MHHRKGKAVSLEHMARVSAKDKAAATCLSQALSILVIGRNTEN